MAAEANPVREPLMGLDEETEKFYKTFAAKIIVSTITYPITTVKTLIQLGHEPFPLSTGRIFIFAGRNAYFLPNGLSYASQLAAQKGYAVLWTGLDSYLTAFFIGGVVSRHAANYLNKYYPEVGGTGEFDNKLEEDLADHESFRKALRAGIRESIVRVAVITAARPFIVLSIRQIAQIIGNETKYQSVVQGLRLVGCEEGPSGLFSGIIPALLSELILVWGVTSLTYIAERSLKHAGLYDKAKEGDQGKKELEDARKLIKLVVPFATTSFAYPYSVMSTVMSVAGSGLIVSFLPYSTWEFLKPNGLKRGSRLFLREQLGAVSVGQDQQLYAMNRHFV